MNDVIAEYLKTQPEAFPDPTYGEGHRCSVNLKDGTFLPCVMLRTSQKRVELALKRFEQEKKGTGIFRKGGNKAYRDIVKHFVTSDNRVNAYDIAKVGPSKHAFPMKWLSQLQGETTMAWTGFALEMMDGKCFSFGTSFLVEFFDLPEGYTFDDVKQLHNHSYVNSSGEVKSLEQGFCDCPEDYAASQIYRDKPFFDCYTDDL